MKKIVFLRGQAPNPRFTKRLNLLKDKFEAVFAYWEKEPTLKSAFVMPNIRVNRIESEADTKNPMGRMKPYYDFRRKAYEVLVTERPDLIYAEALDVLDIACAYKRRKDPDVKIIYEIADLHRYIIDEPKSFKMRVIRRILREIDKRNGKLVDTLVVTSEKFYDVYFSSFISKEKMLFIPNMPDTVPLQGYKPKKHDGVKTIGFIGRIRYINECKVLIQAANKAGWNVLFAGSELGNNGTIKKMCEEYSCKYLGEFDFKSQIRDIYEQCDVVYSVYDSDMMNVRVALPNKLYESIFCELPIIVAKNTYLQELVERDGVGCAVNHDSVDELAELLMSFDSNQEMYNKMCENCRTHKSEIDENIYSAKLIERINSFID